MFGLMAVPFRLGLRDGGAQAGIALLDHRPEQRN
jgi:hypothetical protein